MISKETIKFSMASITLFCHLLLLASIGSVYCTSNLTFTLESVALKIDEIFNNLENWKISANTTLSKKATIFFPKALSKNDFTKVVDPLVVRYHVIPHAFSFFHLKQFKSGTRFPTLLHKKSIIINYNDGTNFAIDGNLISHPDMFYDGKVAIHGVETLLTTTFTEAMPMCP